MSLSLLRSFVVLADESILWGALTPLDRHNLACIDTTLADAIDERTAAKTTAETPLSPRRRLYLLSSELQRVRADVSEAAECLRRSRCNDIIARVIDVHRTWFRKLLALTWKRWPTHDALTEAFEGRLYVYLSESPMIRVHVLPALEIETTITIGGLYMTVTSGRNTHRGFISPRWRYDLFPDLGPPHSLALGVAIMQAFKVTQITMIEAHGVDVESPLAAAIRMCKLDLRCSFER